ncbi:DUF1176 domain-containing protein [Shewanella pneumatophori]|uniref:DUF1176 domain-containing protein n=1 Tax=Shewanella pneumatophori TaxID=314092 RepID=A0A9X1ZB49_9GAMM|nr:DUF1176 domain-containing protein [Shewanella pneumatophori]MCL1138999.1 DUF1176 domain-containing protein [Shewanella pneumatophori]
MNNHLKRIANSYTVAVSVALLSMSALVLPVQAFEGEVQSFFHGDWEAACDNTHTCRAVGYHNPEQKNAAGEYRPVSVIFTRAAGENAKVKGKVKFGALSFGMEAKQTQHNDTITLSINDTYQSVLAPELPAYQEKGMSFSGERELTDNQVSELLKALTMKGRVSIKFGSSAGDEWYLSTKGSTAVLLKMDDFQGLVETPFAIVKKGQASKGIVKPKQAPVISIPAQPIPDTTAADLALVTNADFNQRIRTALNNACDNVPTEDQPLELEIARLTSNKLVVSTMCWSAAYNYGQAVWLVDDDAEIEPVLVTDSAVSYANGVIDEFMRGRGVGDCLSARRYIWNGSEFVLADSYTTGACREIAPGGAWYIPTTVSTVINGVDPAAGIDCESKQAYSTQGMVKCAQRELASLEWQMSEQLAEIERFSHAEYNTKADKSREAAAAIAQAQQAWRTFSKSECKAQQLSAAEGSMSLPLFVGCQVDLTQKRLQQLQLTKQSLMY